MFDTKPTPENGNTWLTQFASVGELLDWNSSPYENVWKSIQYSDQPSSGFTDTSNYAAAEKLARDGWVEGAKKIKHYMDTFFDRVSSKVQTTDIHRGIEPGIMFDVGAFCAGAPDCWLTEEPRIVDGLGNRVLVVNVHVTASASVSASTISARGGAIVATVQALELAGYSVEVNAVHKSSTVNGYGRGETLNWNQETHIRLKASDQPINLENLAFVIAHPSMLRRILFRTIERCQSRTLCEKLYDIYGWPVDVAEAYQGDIYFPKMHTETVDWLDDASALKRIFGLLAKQGVDLGEENVA